MKVPEALSPHKVSKIQTVISFVVAFRIPNALRFEV